MKIILVVMLECGTVRKQDVFGSERVLNLIL